MQRPKAQINREAESEKVRRSSRSRTPQKFDYLTIGMGRHEDYGNIGDVDDDYEPKLNRRRPRSDSDDYVTGPRQTKKNNCNRIANLLEWKRGNHFNESTEPLTQISHHRSKNIPTACLAKFGQGIQGLFINIKWRTENCSQGYTIKDFEKLALQDTTLMSKGIIFVWSEKELMSQIMDVMHAKGFVYIENFQIIYLSLEKGNAEMNRLFTSKSKQPEQEISSHCSAEELKSKDEFIDNMDRLCSTLDGSRIILEQNSRYFKRSKRTLLMFRKDNNEPLELRHQRTCDVLFDLVSEQDLGCDQRTKDYIYRMIQTLLPKTMELNTKKPHFSLMELWADRPRKGWVTIADH